MQVSIVTFSPLVLLFPLECALDLRPMVYEP